MFRLLSWLFVWSRLARDRRARTAVSAMRGLTWQQRASFVSGLARDPRLPRRVRFAPLLAAAYLASPVDLVPDFIPLLGRLDDLVVVNLIFGFVQRSLPPGLLEEHLRRVRARGE